MANVDRNKSIVFEGGFVDMANELSLYNLLGYSQDARKRVTPATLDIYRRLRQHKHNKAGSPMHGKAWPNTKRLAVECAVSENTITKHIAILEAVGLLRIQKTRKPGQNKNVYSFPEPLTEAQFRERYPECIKRYFDALDALQESDDDGEIEAA